MDAKAERYIVNGAHDANTLQDILDGFIIKFVLCPGCNNPETRLSVKKKRIDQVCVACGYRGELLHNHRLMQYIMNHPPDGDKDK
jgi:translation initiation factor 5